jgi:hypothetical protein
MLMAELWPKERAKVDSIKAKKVEPQVLLKVMVSVECFGKKIDGLFIEIQKIDEFFGLCLWSPMPANGTFLFSVKLT